MQVIIALSINEAAERPEAVRFLSKSSQSIFCRQPGQRFRHEHNLTPLDASLQQCGVGIRPRGRSFLREITAARSV